MSVGYDHLDLGALKERNIKVKSSLFFSDGHLSFMLLTSVRHNSLFSTQVGYTPGVLTAATADMTVTLLLATARRLLEGGRRQK